MSESIQDQPEPEAFQLLQIQNVTLSTAATIQLGCLILESITMPDSSQDIMNTTSRNMFLVLRLNSFESPIDPSQTITFSVSEAGDRIYTLRGSDDNMICLTIPVIAPHPTEPHTSLEDLDAFHEILAQYTELRSVDSVPSTSGNFNASQKPTEQPDNQDLRGHLVFVNEDNGEIVGELDNQLDLREDPNINELGSKNDPVVIEIPEEEDPDQMDARTLFVRVIPPSEQDWITKSASMVSYAISGTGKLLLTSMNSASSYYIKNSTPHPSTLTSSPNNSTPPPPPRAIALLSSEKTRQGLASVHAVSAQAVTVSAKTMSLVDSMIKRAVGGKEKGSVATGSSSHITRKMGSSVSPSPSSKSRLLSPSPVPDSHLVDSKPPLPPRSLSPSNLSSPNSSPWLSVPTSATGSPKPPLPSRSVSPSLVNRSSYTMSQEASFKPPLPPRSISPSPSPSYISSPPPYEVRDSQPSLPPRKNKQSDGFQQSSQSSSRLSRLSDPSRFNDAGNPPPPLRTRDRLLLSADLILSTFDDSMKQILEVGSDNIGKAVQHKYGSHVAQSAGLMTGTAKNIGLVYIDMRGIGRRALVKRVGKQYVRSRMSKIRSRQD